MFSLRKQEEKAKQPATRELLQRGEKVIQIPPFYGEFDPNTYLEWEKDVDFVFHCHRYTAEKQVHIATTGFYGYALEWWYQLANKRKQCGELQISSWYEMKAVMKKRFVAKRYGQTDLKRIHCQSGAATGRARTPKDQPKTYYGGETQRKLQLHQAYFEELESTQFKQDLRNMIDQSLTAVIKIPHQGPVPRPASRDDELSCYKKEPAEHKEKIATKPAVKISEIQLQQEEHVPGALCGLNHDQNKAKEEGEPDEALVVHKEPLETLIEQGGFIRLFSCDLLIRPMVCFQFSLVEHLRVVKGLQQVVFEPGGSLSVGRRSNNFLGQKTVSYKLNLQGSFTPKEQDLRSNLFEGREDGVILTSCSKHRGRTGGNTSFISFITDQNKLRRDKQELVVVKGEPEQEDEYGDQTTRPPDQREIKLRVYGLMIMTRTCVGSSWRGAVSFKLNKEEESSAFEGTYLEKSSKMLLRHEKGLQSFVFDPGKIREVRISLKAISCTLVLSDQGSIIIQSLDLRSNPFKGGGDGVAMTRDLEEKLSDTDEEATDEENQDQNQNQRETPGEPASVWIGPVTRSRLKAQERRLLHLVKNVAESSKGDNQDKPACWFNLIKL